MKPHAPAGWRLLLEPVRPPPPPEPSWWGLLRVAVGFTGGTGTLDESVLFGRFEDAATEATRRGGRWAVIPVWPLKDLS